MRKHIVSIIIGILAIVALSSPAGAAESSKGTVFVLCYHSFLGDKPFPSDLSLKDLATQIEFFKQQGYRFVSFSDLVNGKVTGSKNILVSIDDGNQSVYQAYQSVFKPNGIKPLLCIYPNIIGKKPYALTWERLKELTQAGCDIAAHGFYHFPLNQKAYDKDPKAFRQEIFLSKEVLEKKLNVSVKAFAYPNGANAPITKQVLKEAGYRYAFTIQWGPVYSPPSQNSDPLALPRYMYYTRNFGMISGAITKAAL